MNQLKQIGIKRRRAFHGFTLVELIVVITILAILATIGFLALSGYSQDAKDSAIKANVRSLQTAISSEAALTNNSPRYYVVHDPDYALSGAFAYVDGAQVALTGGNIGSAPSDSNYTAGKPDFKKLKLNPEKFKISGTGFTDGIAGVLARATGFGTDSAEASYDPTLLMAAGADFQTNWQGGKKRIVSYVQTAGISPATKLANVIGNFPTTGIPVGNANGLLRAEPGNPSNLTGALVDGGNAAGGTVPEAPTNFITNTSLETWLTTNGFSRYGTLSGNLIATAAIPWSEHVYVFFDIGWVQQLWASRLSWYYSVITERPHPLDAWYNSSFTGLWYWNGSWWGTKTWKFSFCLSGDGTDGTVSSLWISCPGTNNPETTNWAALFAGKANWGNWRLAFLNESGNMITLASPNNTGNDTRVVVYTKP